MDVRAGTFCQRSITPLKVKLVAGEQKATEGLYGDSQLTSLAEGTLLGGGEGRQKENSFGRGGPLNQDTRAEAFVTICSGTVVNG